MKINFSINYKGYTADISYEPEDKIYVGEVRCISDNTDCTTEPEAVEALREAVLKSGKAGTSAFELLCDRIEELLENK